MACDTKEDGRGVHPLDGGAARKARTQAANQLHNLVVTAPQELRERVRDLKLNDLVQVSKWRPGPVTTPLAATKLAMAILARRYLELGAENDRLDVELDRLVQQAGGRLLARKGLGTDTVSALLRGRQPRAPQARSLLRRPVRVLAPGRLIRQAATAPTQPRR